MRLAGCALRLFFFPPISLTNSGITYSYEGGVCVCDFGGLELHRLSPEGLVYCLVLHFKEMS